MKKEWGIPRARARRWYSSGMESHMKQAQVATQFWLPAAKAVAELRMAELGAAHLNQLHATATAAECKTLRGQFLARDWPQLRGHYPRVLQHLERESQQILAKKERAPR